MLVALYRSGFNSPNKVIEDLARLTAGSSRVRRDDQPADVLSSTGARSTRPRGASTFSTITRTGSPSRIARRTRRRSASSRAR